MQVQNVPIGQIKPYKRNPRHNENAVDAVAASIREFGFQQPIVCDMDGVVIVGHTRLKAAAKLGLQTVPVVYADLPEDKVKAYRLADNKTGELAQWDLGLLEAELADIGMDMSEFGFDKVLDEPEEVVEDNYEVVLPEEPKAKVGDLYQLGRHRLMCGDSTSPDAVRALLDGAVIDLVVTDPPYNMGYQGAGRTKDRKAHQMMNDKMTSGEFRHFLRSVYENYCANMRVGASIYVFYKELGEGVFITAMRDGGLTYKQELIWVKNQIVLGGTKYQSMYEPFLMGCKGKSIKVWNGARKQRAVIEDVDFMGEDELRSAIKQIMSELDTDIIRENKQVVNDLHPTMKPVRLIAKLIQNSSNLDDVVCDLFGGSGTTIIAAEQTGRSAYLMELDPRFVDVIVDRWEKFTGEKAVLLNGSRNLAG